MEKIGDVAINAIMIAAKSERAKDQKRPAQCRNNYALGLHVLTVATAATNGYWSLRWSGALEACNDYERCRELIAEQAYRLNSAS